jgi:endonuclease/exonuclease/phosphatase family metal-dependent hydrolase
MASIFRKITKKFVVIANIVLAIVFLIACLSNYVNPVKYWFIAFLGLGFPYILLLVILFLIGWIFLKSKWSLLNVALLLIGWQSINAIFAFNLFAKKFTQQKKEQHLRVLHWNSMSFGEYVKDRVRGSEIRDEMLAYIKEQDADVLCLQEFFDSKNNDFNENLEYVSQKLGYPNYYFTKDYERHLRIPPNNTLKIGHWGSIIFTKLPIADSGKTAFIKVNTNDQESICFLDMVFNTDTIRVMTTHLQSIRLNPNDYEKINEIKKAEQIEIEPTKGIFAKIKRAYKNRRNQADVCNEEINKSPYPVIVTGDFNDVPNSYTYSTIKGNMQDVFLKKGFGIGRTFNAISPTLRIDYILADKRFKVHQVKKESLNLSDHYPVICDLELKK